MFKLYRYTKVEPKDYLLVKQAISISRHTNIFNNVYASQHNHYRLDDYSYVSDGRRRSITNIYTNRMK